MTTLREAAQQALEALELGYDSAKAEADQYHAAMAGYRPQLHAQMDAHVQQIAAAITALKAALVEDAMQKFTDVNQEIEAALAETQTWVCPEAPDTHRYDKPGHCEDCGNTLVQIK